MHWIREAEPSAVPFDRSMRLVEERWHTLHFIEHDHAGAGERHQFQAEQARVREEPLVARLVQEIDDMASGKVARVQVLLPTPRTPNMKKLP